ncbi:MAG: NADH-quinone oxidoreductase subunit N, partial [Gemmatimonadales bacterium]
MDLSTAAGLVAALLPEIVLTVIGMIVLLLGAWKHGSARAMKVIGWVTVAGFAVTLLMFATMWRNAVTAEGFTSMIALDPFRYASGILVLLAAVLTTALSIDYLEREQLKLPEYYAMMIFAVLGMLFMTGASDLIVVFVGLELMSVSVYVLAGINRHSLFSAEAALKYFLLGAFASGFLLYGIALIYGATGTTNLTLINFQVGASDLAGSVMLLAGVGMLLIGFAFKVAAVPFHMWAPDVYDGSPTPVTSFMATAVKVAGFAALVRILFHAFGNWTVIWQDAIWWLAAVTMIGGNLMALAQRKLKRMLAYSSIG